MSLIYCKSLPYLRDNDDRIITNNEGALPYSFVNQFKEPIKVSPDDKIELVSADLRISPSYSVSEKDKNNAITFGIGNTGSGSLQKLTKLDDGSYNETELVYEIESQMNLNQNLDLAEWDMDYNNTDDGDIGIDKFKLLLKNQPSQYNNENEYQTDKVEFENLSTKMGFQAPDSYQNIGVGGSQNELTIENNNSEEKPFTTFKTKNIEKYVLRSDTSNMTNTNKLPLLISNTFSPQKTGLQTAAGNFSTIIKPVSQFQINPTNFLTAGVGKSFSYMETTTNQVIRTGVLKAYSGSYGWDVELDSGSASLFFMKFITTEKGTSPSAMEYYNLPNSVSSLYYNWGHFVVISLTDVAPSNNFQPANGAVLQLDTQEKSLITKWTTLGGNNSGWQYELRANDATATSFLQSQLIETKLPYYGACGIGVSRGECVLTGLPNQVNQGANGRYSRVNVLNTTPYSANSFVGNNIICDYVLNLTPNLDMTDMYYNIGFGTQNTNKTAGQPDWLTMNSPVQDETKTLTELFNGGFQFGVDNLMMTIKTYNNNCVGMYLAHDTAGDLQFGIDDVLGLIHIADTEIDLTPNNLGKNLCEQSVPFSPVIFTSTNPIVGSENYYTIGTYSKKDALIHNLSSLYTRTIAKWGNSETIPARQPKINFTNTCSNYNFNNLTITFNPVGFSGQTGIKSFFIPLGKIESVGTSGISEIVVRTSYFAVDSSDGKRLTDDLLMTYEPSSKTFLGEFLGFDSLLSKDITDPSIFEKFSDNTPNYNNSENYIINLGLGNIRGSNSATSRVSRMVAVIPDSALSTPTFTDERSYTAPYPLPVDINIATEQNINNFQISITTDDNRPATSIRHPSTFLFRITK